MFCLLDTALSSSPRMFPLNNENFVRGEDGEGKSDYNCFELGIQENMS
jgi:hypothetical protein